jgi:hypothetical protein
MGTHDTERVNRADCDAVRPELDMADMMKRTMIAAWAVIGAIACGADVGTDGQTAARASSLRI